MDDKSGRFYGPIKGVGSRRDGSSALGFGSARLGSKQKWGWPWHSEEMGRTGDLV